MTLIQSLSPSGQHPMRALFAFSLLGAFMLMGHPLLAQHNHDHDAHHGHNHPDLTMESLIPLEEWGFETGEAVEPFQVRFQHIADTWVLQALSGSPMAGKRFIPVGIPESGLEAAELDPHETYVVEGHLGIVPSHIRMIGVPLKVSRILLLEQAQEED